MVSYTTNLALVKPAGGEQALISQINGNMDIIDGAVKTNTDAVSTLSGFTRVTPLPASVTDLNTVLEQAVYFVSSSTTAATIANVPTNIDGGNSGFYLEVFHAQGSSFGYQRYSAIGTGATNNQTMVRTWTASGATWGPWVRAYSDTGWIAQSLSAAYNAGNLWIRRMGDICMLKGNILKTSGTWGSASSGTIATFASQYRPVGSSKVASGHGSSADQVARLVIGTDGTFSLQCNTALSTADATSVAIWPDIVWSV